MANVLAVTDGAWVTAEIVGPRLMRRALREAIVAADLIFDPEERLWRIRAVAWQAACDVFWRYQMSVDLFEWSPLPSSGVPFPDGFAARKVGADAIRRSRRLAAHLPGGE